MTERNEIEWLSECCDASFVLEVDTGSIYGVTGICSRCNDNTVFYDASIEGEENDGRQVLQ